MLITRPADQAGDMAQRLAALGAETVLCSTVSIAPPDDYGPLDRAIAEIADFDRVIFTSVNGVRFFMERLVALERPIEPLKALWIGAIGPATAQALGERGLVVDFVPGQYVAEAIVAGIGEVSGERILLPRADIARKALAEGLRAKGAAVCEVVAYRTVPADPGQAAGFLDGDVPLDIATFTSPSTVRNFVALLGEHAPDERLGGATIACIGPITARAAESEGLHVDVMAEEHTIPGLIQAILAYQARQKV